MGAKLDPKWVPKWSQKVETKMIQSGWILTRVWSQFWAEVREFRMPELSPGGGGQKGWQKRQGTKTCGLPNNQGKPSQKQYFVPCRGHFRRPRAGKSVPGMRCFWKCWVKATLHRFLVDLGTILGSKSGPQVAEKSDQQKWWKKEGYKIGPGANKDKLRDLRGWAWGPGEEVGGGVIFK